MTSAAVRDARSVGGQQSGQLVVAAVSSVAVGVLPPVLRSWRRSHPDVTITLVEHRHTDELRDAMAAGAADLAVGPAPHDWPGPVRDLGVEEFLVLLSADDPTPESAPARVRMHELADGAWVHYAPGNGLADVLDQACAASGFRPRSAIRTEQTAAAASLTAAGLGPALVPALVPANVVPSRFSGRLLRPLPPVQRTLAADTRSAADPLTAASSTRSSATRA